MTMTSGAPAAIAVSAARELRPAYVLPEHATIAAGDLRFGFHMVAEPRFLRADRFEVPTHG